MRSRSIPFWISAFIHFAVIGAAAALFIQPSEFAMDTGHNSVEVNLVAAAPAPAPPPPPVQEPQEPALTQPPKPDDVTVPVAPPVPPTPIPPSKQPLVQAPPLPILVPPKPHRIHTVAKGDGSSPKPGRDAITASSDGGAIMDVKPDYLSNPPPIYPESSRQEKQEGVVVLQVIVNTEGRVETLSIETTSGFKPLDESAITAVRSWRFRPASLGNIKMKSRVVIPIRFRLDN